MRTQVKGQSWYRAISVRFPQWTYIVDSQNPNISDSYAFIGTIRKTFCIWYIIDWSVRTEFHFNQDSQKVGGRLFALAFKETLITDQQRRYLYLPPRQYVGICLDDRALRVGGRIGSRTRKKYPPAIARTNQREGQGRALVSTDPVGKQDGGQVRWHVGQQDSNEWKLLRTWLNTLDTQLYTYQFKIICMQYIFIDQQQWPFCWKDIYMLID